METAQDFRPWRVERPILPVDERHAGERIVGRDAIRATVKGWLDAMPSIDFRFNHVVVDGNIVLMERCDLVSTTSGTAELPIMAVIELENGKIAAWREYFDLLQMQALSSTK